MKANAAFLTVIACAGFFCACAATVPPGLVNAREAYRRASAGPAAKMAPAELHVANEALQQAERAFEDDPDSYQTRDFSYIALRKSEQAEATASVETDQKRQRASNTEYQATQTKISAERKEDLTRSQAALAESRLTGESTAQALAVSERSGSATAALLSAEQTARNSAEERAAAAQAELAKLGAVKEEPRGTVITLSGSVLFASNQSVLLPEARTRLDQVAAVLLSSRSRNIIIEGHTDSNGTDAHNQDLSKQRADAVRNYLVQQNYDASRIQSTGMGEGHPIADNGTAEGRANNRRVEIVISRDQHASNP